MHVSCCIKRNEPSLCVLSTSDRHQAHLHMTLEILQVHSSLHQTLRSESPVVPVVQNKDNMESTYAARKEARENILNLVDSHTGAPDHKQVKSFIRSVKNAVAMSGVPWSMMPSLLVSKTEGSAQQWLDDNQHLFIDFDVFKRLMMEKFGPSQADLTNAFETCSLEPGEDIRHYHHRFVTLVADLDIDPNHALAIQHYIHGLGEVGALVSITKHRDLESILETVTNLQGFMRRHPNTAPMASVGALLAHAGLHSSYSNAAHPATPAPAHTLYSSPAHASSGGGGAYFQDQQRPYGAYHQPHGNHGQGWNLHETPAQRPAVQRSGVRRHAA